MTWLAEQAPLADPATAAFWLQWGPLGLVVFLFLFGFLHSNKDMQRVERDRDQAIARAEAERDRAIQERDELRAQRDAMAAVFQDKALPTLGEFLAVIKVLLPTLQDIAQRPRRRPRPDAERDRDDW